MSSKEKLFVDLSKCINLKPTNLSTNIISNSNGINKFHLNSKANTYLNDHNHYSFSNNNNNNNANANHTNIIESSINLQHHNINGKRISSSPRSTSSINSACTTNSNSSTYSTSNSNSNTGSIMGTSSSYSYTASSRSGSSCNSVITYSSSASSSRNSNTSSTIHCEDSNSNNTCNMSPYSYSFESANSSSISSNDEEDTVKTKKTNKQHTYSNNNSFTCSDYSLNNSSCMNTSTTNSTFTSRTTRTSIKSSMSSSPVSNTNDENDKNKAKCLWHKCKFVGRPIDVDDSLIDHIKTKHINVQKNYFRCLWNGCNVYNRQSRSFSWLEPHVVHHIDAKPFACIIGECKKKFHTESALERHVHSHMNNSNSASMSAAMSPYASPAKTNLLKKSINDALINNSINPKNERQGTSSFNEITSNASNTILSKNNLNNKNSKNLGNLNGTSSCTISNSTATASQAVPSKLPNCYSKLRKDLTKKRKNQTHISQIKKFKKVQYEDFIDTCSSKVLEHKLNKLSYDCGNISFECNILGFNKVDDSELVLVEWVPRNIIENEWIEKSNLMNKVKEMSSINLSELYKHCNFVRNDVNPFYRKSTYRQNRRK